MSKNVKFLVGKELNLSSLTKNPGQLIVALDEDNSKGKIYFDESNTNRIELSPGLYTGDDVVESTTPINADTLNGYTAEDLINMGVGGGGGGSSVFVDAELSATSENPVQNKVITTALNGKSDNEHTHSIADVKNLQTTLDEINETANTQSDWNQTDETAPDYIKNKPDSMIAFEALVETGFVRPVSNTNNALYTNNSGAIYVL